MKLVRETPAADGTDRRAPRRTGVLVTLHVRPQALNGGISIDEIDLIGTIIASRLRKEDGFDLRPDGTFTVELARSDRGAALVAGHRIAHEITRRTFAINPRKWVAEFVAPALPNAQRRRRQA